jgi:hypothetical protein
VIMVCSKCGKEFEPACECGHRLTVYGSQDFFVMNEHGAYRGTTNKKGEIIWTPLQDPP